MQTFVTVIHIVVCLLLVLVVLLQSGKGAEISTTLGGSSQTIFGSSGGANFFTNLTSVLAGVFMMTSVSLTIFGRHERKSVFETIEALPVSSITPPATSVPVSPDNKKEQMPVEKNSP